MLGVWCGPEHNFIRYRCKRVAAIAAFAAALLAAGAVQARSPYCTAKAALIHFTLILAMDHAADNIRANTISSGCILTERIFLMAGPFVESERPPVGLPQAV
jgi:NAD(P)-dependent dehydrogenase (short-subunit alcohol dehydrogenase family)